MIKSIYAYIYFIIIFKMLLNNLIFIFSDYIYIYIFRKKSVNEVERMGSLLSLLAHNVLHFLPSFLWTNNANVYRQPEVLVTVSDKKNSNKACRSSNQNHLTAYQSKVDNLKQDEIVYVIKF